MLGLNTRYFLINPPFLELPIIPFSFLPHSKKNRQYLNRCKLYLGKINWKRAERAIHLLHTVQLQAKTQYNYCCCCCYMLGAYLGSVDIIDNRGRQINKLPPA